MNATQLLRELRRRHVVLTPTNGESIRYRAPAGSLADLRAALVDLKHDILAVLKAPGDHEVCTYFCGNPKTDRYCRKCGGTWIDYVARLTGISRHDS